MTVERWASAFPMMFVLVKKVIIKQSLSFLSVCISIPITTIIYCMVGSGNLTK